MDIGEGCLLLPGKDLRASLQAQVSPVLALHLDSTGSPPRAPVLLAFLGQGSHLNATSKYIKGATRRCLLKVNLGPSKAGKATSDGK